MGVNKPQLFGKAVEVFTDREEPRKTFWKLYREMQSGEFKVLHFYGTGGIGKTSLLKKIQLELEEEKITSYFSYSFENIKPKAEILADFSRILGERLPGIKFPVFEYAYLRYKQMSGEDVADLKEKRSRTFLDGKRAGMVMKVLAEFVPYGSQMSDAVKGGARVSKRLFQKYEQTAGKDSDIFESINNSNSVEILRNLQQYFAYDVFDYFKELKDPFVIMLDGYEGLVNKLEKGDKAVNDDLWLREEDSLIRSMPNVIWVVAGRERLEWSKDLLDPKNAHLIGDLSERDSIDFFKNSGVSDEKLCMGLYKLTSGTPVYMDLCIKTYKGILRKKGENYTPAIEEFGHNTEELAARYLRDMTITEQNLVKLISCLPNIWNDAMVETIARKLKIDFSYGEYRLIKELSLVENDVNEPEYYKLHETFRKVVVAQIEEEELRDMAAEVAFYLTDEIENMSGNDPKLYSRVVTLVAYLKQYKNLLSLPEYALKELLDDVDMLGGVIELDLLLDLARDIQCVMGEMCEAEVFDRYSMKGYNLLVKLLHRGYRLEEARPLAEGNYQAMKDEKILNGVDTFEIILEYAAVCMKSGDYTRAEELCDEALQIAEENEKISLDNRVELLAVLHKTLVGKGETDRLKEVEEERIRMCKKAYERWIEEYGESYSGLGYYLTCLYNAYVDAERYEEALDAAEEDYRLFVRDSKADGLEELVYHKRRAHCLYCLGRQEESLEAERQWHQAGYEYFGEDHPYTWEAKRSMANSLYDAKAYAEAAKLYRQVYEGYLSKVGEDSWSTLSVLRDMADALWMSDEEDGVVEMYLKVYDYALKNFGENDEDTLDVQSSLAECYRYLGETKQAIEWFGILSDSYIRVYGREEECTVWACGELAHLLRQTGELEEASALYEENIKIMERAENPDKLLMAEYCYYAGKYRVSAEQVESGAAYLEKAQALILETNPENGLLIAVRFRLSFAYVVSERAEEAIALLEQVIASRTARWGTEHESVIDATSLLAVAHEKTENYEKAKELAKWCYETDIRKYGEEGERTRRDKAIFTRIENGAEQETE